MTTTTVETTRELSLEPVRTYLEAAQQRESPARHLAGRRDWVAALHLYLEAAALLMRAKLASAGDLRPLDELPPSELLDSLLELAKSEGWTAPAELERVRPLLSATKWPALDRLSEADAERASDDLRAALRFVAGTIPSVRQAERRRELRRFAVGAALLGLGALGALLWSLTRPTNLALKRPVRATPAGFETSAEEAVNGVRFGEIGFHSKDDSPWLEVDLEAERTIQRVEIYGRGDCCFGQSIPLLVEGSIDGKTYVTWGQLDEPFRPFRPWVLPVKALENTENSKNTKARYVRVRPLRRTFLVIAEIEVY